MILGFGAAKPLGPAGDPFWSSVVFLQTFDSLSVGTVLSDPLASESGGSITATFASRYTVSNAQARFGNSAQNTTGNLCNLSTTLSGPFTFEGSGFYTTQITKFLAVVSNFNSIASFALLSGNLYVTCSEGGTSFTGSAVSANTWYDAAVSWDGSVLRCFWNGQLVHSSTKTNPATAFNMAYSSTSNPGSVFADDVRITSACRYTASYTPAHPFPTS